MSIVKRADTRLFLSRYLQLVRLFLPILLVALADTSAFCANWSALIPDLTVQYKYRFRPAGPTKFVVLNDDTAVVADLDPDSFTTSAFADGYRLGHAVMVSVVFDLEKVIWGGGERRAVVRRKIPRAPFQKGGVLVDGMEELVERVYWEARYGADFVGSDLSIVRGDGGYEISGD